MSLCFAEPPQIDVPLEEELQAYLAAYSVEWLDTLLREHGLHVAVLSGMAPLNPFARAEHVMAQARFLELCVQFDALGGGTIVVSPETQFDSPIGEGAFVAGMARALCDLSAIAAPFEVRIAFEFQSETQSIESWLTTGRQIVRQAARQNVGLALNTAYLYLSGDRDLEAIPDAVTIGIVQLYDVAERPDAPQMGVPRLLLPGQGAAPLRAMYERLERKGFRGPYSIGRTSESLPARELCHKAWQAAQALFASG
jgi:2-keto-myo-inositol isomerase